MLYSTVKLQVLSQILEQVATGPVNLGTVSKTKAWQLPDRCVWIFCVKQVSSVGRAILIRKNTMSWETSWFGSIRVKSFRVQTGI